jgi:hypothetical protein
LILFLKGLYLPNLINNQLPLVKNMIQFETMPVALTSNSPGVARGRKQDKNTHPGGVNFKLLQLDLWKEVNPSRVGNILGIIYPGCHPGYWRLTL